MFGIAALYYRQGRRRVDSQENVPEAVAGYFLLVGSFSRFQQHFSPTSFFNEYDIQQQIVYFKVGSTVLGICIVERG